MQEAEKAQLKNMLEEAKAKEEEAKAREKKKKKENAVKKGFLYQADRIIRLIRPYGVSVEEIALETGLTKEEINEASRINSEPSWIQLSDQ